MNTFLSGIKLHQIVLRPFWKGVNYKRKDFAPFGKECALYGSNIFPFMFWNKSASRGGWCAGEQTGPSHAKKCLRDMRTAKTQINLHIRAAWSGPSLSANRIIGYYRMFEWRAKAQMILCACESESAQFCACSKAIRRLTRPNWKSLRLSPLFWMVEIHSLLR